ncbi:protein NipSnap homolog 3A isoform X2 [Stegostoma tigrinum]|uniref:protein NipSnap homolog 3A isoform X2 n=1 Tax=Stegostoma tigrinum TaxID=3053191 RepID=UPI00202B4006|nr:protein NipSnap homolog 3A isoform X2 [Stegostoma tigrinum]
MYILRSALNRSYAAAPRSLSYPSSMGQQRSIGTSRGSNQLSGTFYEFRSYVIQPGKIIFSLGSYKERSAVREALANNKDWQQNYISKMLPMLLSQTSEIVYMVPWAELGKPPKKGIYELVTYQMVPGGPVVWGKAFQKAVSAHSNVGYCTLIGVFHSEFGQLNKVHVLWWHEDGDHRASGRHRSHEDVRVVAAVRDSASYLVTQTNKLLLPTSYSPLK